MEKTPSVSKIAQSLKMKKCKLGPETERGKTLALEKYKTYAAVPRPFKEAKKIMGRTAQRHAMSTSSDYKDLLKKSAAALPAFATSSAGNPKAGGKGIKKSSFHQTNVKVVARIRPLNKRESV